MKKYILSALMVCGLTATAQTINFETSDYQSVSVYDNWEQSPFRKGEMLGHAMVANNPNKEVDPIMGQAPNPSDKVVAVQRSRFGSNTFGVRINLNQPFRLKKTNQYLHVMAYFPNKPASSRVMVIGLGKRVESDWSWQDGTDEQFWALTTDKVEGTGAWQDLVFSFKGFSYSTDENANKGIDIYSLVIVPDVRSPHKDTQDFACYFDDIEINTNSQKRFTTEKYAVNFVKKQAPTRSDRKLNSFTFASQTVNHDQSLVYNDKSRTTLLKATPGQNCSFSLNYSGSWMAGYAYIDWNKNGMFEATVNSNGTPATGSDIVSYSAADVSGSNTDFRNSAGTSLPNGNTLSMPNYTIPANQPCGFYRMRIKTDWNCLDAGGNTDSNNLLVANGGSVDDVMLDVHGTTVTVNQQQLNGDIHTADGGNLSNYAAPYGQAFTVRMDPAPGFIPNGFTVRYGYELDNDAQYDGNGNPRWFERTYTASDLDANDQVTLPADVMIGGNVRLTGEFKSTTGGDAYTLNDGESWTPGTYSPLTYKRTFNSTKYQALYIPFAMQYKDWSSYFDVYDINQVVEYDNNNDGVIDAAKLEVLKLTSGSIQANLPYVIKPKATGDAEILINSATLQADTENAMKLWSVDNDFTFYGTYHEVTDMYANGYYALGNGALVQAASAGTTLAPHRWYLTITDNQNNTVNVGRLEIVELGEGTTGIQQNILSKNAQTFDLQGRKVQNTQKGHLYIMGNKKVIK